MEPISFFLSTFMALADRIIDLDKEKIKDKKDLFNEIIKPLFEELEPVALNYMEFFQRSRQIIIDTPQKDLADVVEVIQKERNAMIFARIRVREMASQIEKHINNEQIVMFAMSVNDFFYSDPLGHPALIEYRSSAASTGRGLLEMIKYTILQSDEKKVIIDYIDKALEIFEKAWASIVQSYGALKIYSISPPKFVRKSQTKKTKSQ
jgi:hypothetical protein